jgi:hypothetical protein
MTCSKSASASMTLSDGHRGRHCRVNPGGGSGILSSKETVRGQEKLAMKTQTCTPGITFTVRPVERAAKRLTAFPTVPQNGAACG